MSELFTAREAMVQCPKCGSGLIETVYKPGKSPVFDAAEGTVTHLNICRNCGHEYEVVFVLKEFRNVGKMLVAKQRVVPLDDKLSYLIPEAESKIGPDWYIFNAARPIPGHVTWTADFLHGVFYAAIDPHSESAYRYAKDCVAFGGWLVVFVDKEQVYSEVQAHYDTHFPDSGIKARSYSFQAVFSRYLDVVVKDSVVLRFENK